MSDTFWEDTERLLRLRRWWQPLPVPVQSAQPSIDSASPGAMRPLRNECSADWKTFQRALRKPAVLPFAHSSAGSAASEALPATSLSCFFRKGAWPAEHAAPSAPAATAGRLSASFPSSRLTQQLSDLAAVPGAIRESVSKFMKSAGTTSQARPTSSQTASPCSTPRRLTSPSSMPLPKKAYGPRSPLHAALLRPPPSMAR